MYRDIDELAIELKSVLEANDYDMESKDCSDIMLKIEIRNAIAEINNCRRFTPKEGKLYDSKYAHLIIPLCEYAYSKKGAEGETSHDENGVKRVYSSSSKYPKDVLMSITPLAK